MKQKMPARRSLGEGGAKKNHLSDRWLMVIAVLAAASICVLIIYSVFGNGEYTDVPSTNHKSEVQEGAKGDDSSLTENECNDDLDCPTGEKCEDYGCVDAGCVAEGDSLPGPISPEYADHMASECCDGLEAISDKNYYDENCEDTGFVGAGDVCSKCGNGVCEEWETKCNCAADCK